MKMKLMVMTLVVAMLLSMSAFAASVGYTGIESTGINDDADYSITVNYSATGYNTGDQITLLVLTGSSEITWSDDAKTIPANVAYIDQEAIEGATGSFTFTVAKSFVAEKEVYVKLGATAQTTAAGSEAITDFISGGSDEPSTGDTVLENGTNATVSDATTSTTLGDAIGAIYTVAITDTALAGKVPQAYVGETAVGTVLLSTERNKYIVVVPTANAADTITMKAVDAASASVTEFIYGDANGKDGFTANDAQIMTQKLKQVRDNIDTVVKKIAADVNGDGQITANDVQLMTQKLKQVRDFAILKK